MKKRGPKKTRPTSTWAPVVGWRNGGRGRGGGRPHAAGKCAVRSRKVHASDGLRFKSSTVHDIHCKVINNGPRPRGSIRKMIQSTGSFDCLPICWFATEPCLDSCRRAAKIERSIVHLTLPRVSILTRLPPCQSMSRRRRACHSSHRRGRRHPHRTNTGRDSQPSPRLHLAVFVDAPPLPTWYVHYRGGVGCRMPAWNNWA